MAINSYFFDAVANEDGTYDRTYSADDFTSYLKNVVGDGVFPTPSDSLQVNVSSGMNVVVKSGSGWINGHRMNNTEDLTLTVAAADSVLDRIDGVVFYVDYAERSMGISVKTGTVAAIPVVPDLVRTDEKYEMLLATIYVNANATAVTDSMITDTRMNSEVCGYVQGVIQQVSTETLWKQQQAMLNEFMAVQENLFAEWFTTAKNTLQEAKAFKKYEGVYVTASDEETTFNVKKYVPHYSFVYDILEVYVDGIRLNATQYTIINNVVTVKDPIEKAGTTLAFVVYKSKSE